jgi:hypothetical protein
MVEAVVVIGYAHWREKPARPILLTSICINFLTQSLLWIALNLFFRHYLIALIVAELVIWGIESIFLYSIPANHLCSKEAIFLSLGMNVSSFGLGWFLPT